MTRRILISGSRRFTDAEFVLSRLCMYVQDDPWKEIVLVHGAEPKGVDACVDRIVRGRVVPCEQDPHPADWSRYRKAAGPRRNGEMVALGAEVLIAFPDPQSTGTVDCIQQAWRAGIPVRIYPVLLDPPKRHAPPTEPTERRQQMRLLK